MNGTRPNKTSFNKQAHSYENRPFYRTSAVRPPYRAPWVLTVNSSQNNIDDKGYWDSGCSRHMTGNISYLSDFESSNGGYVSFGQGGCKITRKGTIKTGKLEFENVYFVKDLKYNLFSVLQICDNKNSVLLTDSDCIVLGRDFKLLDDANILLRTPRQHNIYSINLNNIVPYRNLTCLVAKASADECTLWHRRTFFLKSKDETSGILKKFITEIENPKDLKVKIIRCDNRGEFRNKEMNDFCSQKEIKREFSNARTPQQNGVSKRINRTLIEAAKTMLADAKLHVTFWAEAVNTACYVQNKILVNKSHNKTPYELFNSRSPAIGFLKPFGYHVMILNTLDNLGKFEEKRDEGYFIGYSMSSKAFRVFNKRTRRVEENLHVEFLENKAIEKGDGLNWLFDIDSLTKSINYVPVDADHCSTEVPEGSGNPNPTASTSNPPADLMETLIVETPIPTTSSPFEDILGGTTNSDESNGVESDISTMEIAITASPTPTLKIHKDHPKDSFYQKEKRRFHIVQVYVDNIIFRSSNTQLCREFEALMHEKFQMSAMGELNFFLVKRNFRCLKGHLKLGLWYPKESPFDLVAYSDSDYGGATQDRKSTTGGWTSKYWGVLRILMISLRLIPLTEHNANFHPMVDFIKASPLSQGEACPTESSFIADQDRATIAKSSTLPHDSAPRVTSPAAVVGSMQQKIPELTALCTSLQRQLSELTAKFQAQEVEINRLKDRVNLLEDRERVAALRSRDNAPIKERSMDEGDIATERISDYSEEMATVLTSIDVATVLASGVVDVSTGSGSIPTASTPAEEQVPIGSDVVPTASPIFATATVVTPYRRTKGKEVMVESETLKKQKVQEQIDAQVARELEEHLEREDQRRSTHTARDAEIARIYAEEELQIMIDGLDRNNETVAKYLQEYHQFALELPIERRIKLITDLESAKKQKTSKEVPEEAMSPKEVPEEKVYTEGQRSYWKITRLGGSSASYQFFIDILKHLDREDLNQLWRLVKETLSHRPPTSEKEMELWVKLNRLYESDDED
nr:ribonuclease H-like domain-containing protein [Tanacetum cinerariifolium]